MTGIAFVVAALIALNGSPQPMDSPAPAPPAATAQPAPAMSAPVPAPAATPASPVQVESCNVSYNGNVLVGTTGKLVINFTNYGSVAADVIRFHVQYGDQSLFIRDVGTFSPGIEIQHKFSSFEGDLQLSPLLTGQKPVMCTVAWSHFVNGTIWPAAATTP
ncbi:MAG TPA: hypothetical protein VKT51_09280 [Candidatus Eremiobacteraceae bacterium]|nr:hypothetical protein [Candidatus Eremiobacteraceae bacterium]